MRWGSLTVENDRVLLALSASVFERLCSVELCAVVRSVASGYETAMATVTFLFFSQRE